MSSTTEKIKSNELVTGGRMAAEERRHQILNVAIRLFSERGFRGTTTKEIAQAAGVSEAIIFRHFATKEELYTAIIDYKCGSSEITDFMQALAQTAECDIANAIKRKDDRALFEGIALALLKHHERSPEFIRLLFYSALEGHQLAQMFWDRAPRQTNEFLSAYIRERQRDGAFREVDPSVVVHAFKGMIIHYTLHDMFCDKSKNQLNISREEAAKHFTEILLKGISSQENKTLRTESKKRTASNIVPPKKKR